MAAQGEYVFVSYTRDDRSFVEHLAQDLIAAGHPIFLDSRNIRLGDKWDATVKEAIENSTHFVVVLTPKSVRSENVLDEIHIALNKRKTIIPILLKDCDLPLRIIRTQWLDFRTGYNSEGFNLLVKRLSGEEPTVAGPSGKVPSRVRKVLTIGLLATALLVFLILGKTDFLSQVASHRLPGGSEAANSLHPTPKKNTILVPGDSHLRSTPSAPSVAMSKPRPASDSNNLAGKVAAPATKYPDNYHGDSLVPLSPAEPPTQPSVLARSTKEGRRRTFDRIVFGRIFAINFDRLVWFPEQKNTSPLNPSLDLSCFGPELRATLIADATSPAMEALRQKALNTVGNHPNVLRELTPVIHLPGFEYMILENRTTRYVIYLFTCPEGSLVGIVNGRSDQPDNDELAESLLNGLEVVRNQQ